MADNSELDFDPTDAPQEVLGVQAHHISAQDLYKFSAIRDLLNDAGITINSRANFILAPTDPAYSEFLQSLSPELRQKFVDAGLAANYQNTSHPSYTAAERLIYREIDRRFPRSDSNSQTAQRITETRIAQLYFTGVAGGMVTDPDGHILPIIGTNADFVDARKKGTLPFSSLSNRAALCSCWVAHGDG
jgi:ABC-type transport system substrate-binding protein